MKDRFVIKPSESKADHWVCSDVDNGINCVFRNKNFNDTQEYSFFDEVEIDVSLLAKLANEMAQWLRNNHYNKLF